MIDFPSVKRHFQYVFVFKNRSCQYFQILGRFFFPPQAGRFYNSKRKLIFHWFSAEKQICMLKNKIDNFSWFSLSKTNVFAVCVLILRLTWCVHLKSAENLWNASRNSPPEFEARCTRPRDHRESFCFKKIQFFKVFFENPDPLTRRWGEKKTSQTEIVDFD